MRPFLILCALATTTAGCAQSPTINTIVQSRSHAVNFKGYASAPGALIRLQCKRPGASSWTSMPSTFANNAEVNSGEQHLLYRFSTMRTIPNSCWAWGDLGYNTIARVLEPNASQVTQLYTFDDNGLGCAIGELIDGEDWVVAGAVCNNGNELKLYANP